MPLWRTQWCMIILSPLQTNPSESKSIVFFLHILHQNFCMNFYSAGWHDGNNAASVPAPFHQGLRSVPGRLAQLQEARLHQAHPPVQRQLAFVPFWSSAFSNNSLCSFLSQIPIKITSNSAHESVIAVCPSRYVCAVITDLYLFSNEHVSLIASYLSQYGDCTPRMRSTVVSISHKLVQIECSHYLAKMSSCQAAPQQQTVATIKF